MTTVVPLLSVQQFLVTLTGDISYADSCMWVHAACYRRVQMRELNKKEAKLYGKMFAALGKGSSSEPAAAAPMEEDQPAAAATAAGGADAAASAVEATA